LLVELLLKLGDNSGPIALVTFFTVIKAPYLSGILVNHPRLALIKDTRARDVYVNVQTNDGLENTGAPVGSGNLNLSALQHA
jgi:hypothetical protein